MHKIYNYLIINILILSIFASTGCKKTSGDKEEVARQPEKTYTEEALYRPHFHFTPKEKWMNDPNGMFYYNGIYHLYFQHYPEDNVWGPMHWGHAVSKDMVRWTEKPIALYPDEKGYIFSGSAVVDINNTSGFGSKDKPPVIAMFTYHDPEGEKAKKIDYQSQAIAYSLDEGYTWTKYEGNPVIQNPGIKDFRDPKILWDAMHNQWLMVLAAGDETLFYSSKNLKDWKQISSFGKDTGAHGGVWECPDFFPMTVAGSGETKWVLLLSINPGAPNGGSGTQYFIGDFDGKTFTLDPSFKKDLDRMEAVWIDYGRDNYAGVTWSGIPETDGRKLWLGWMSNWRYAQQVPTTTWRSAMTMARKLQLIKTGENYRLLSQPVAELKKYITKTVKKEEISTEGKKVLFKKEEIDPSRASVRFTVDNLKEDRYTFLLYNSAGDTLRFGLNNVEKFFFIDRSGSGDTGFSEKFADSPSKAPVTEAFNTLQVEIVMDKTSVEIFYNEGRTVMTELFFPRAPMETFAVAPGNSAVEIKNLTIHQLTLN